MPSRRRVVPPLQTLPPDDPSIHGEAPSLLVGRAEPHFSELPKGVSSSIPGAVVSDGQALCVLASHQTVRRRS